MKKITLLLLAGLSMITISAFTVMDREGMIDHTGSPRDGMTCSMTGCHTSTGVAPSATITTTPTFGAGNTYTAGQTYTVSVVCSGSYPKYGFDLEILNSNTTSAMDAGTFGAVVTSNCRKANSTGRPTNITHSAPTGASNAATFSFRWTAPASGTAYLYYVVNGVNFDDTPNGDVIKTYSATITQSLTDVPLLEQNLSDITIFPNPARDYATISYRLKENTDMKIDFYDVSGKNAGILLAENQSSGDYQKTISFSSMNLKTGIYFVVMKAGDKIRYKKLIVD